MAYVPEVVDQNLRMIKEIMFGRESRPVCCSSDEGMVKERERWYTFFFQAEGRNIKELTDEQNLLMCRYIHHHAGHFRTREASLRNYFFNLCTECRPYESRQELTIKAEKITELWDSMRAVLRENRTNEVPLETHLDNLSLIRQK